MKKLLLFACISSLTIALQAQSCCTASSCSNTGCSDQSVNGMSSFIGVRYATSSSRFHLSSMFGEDQAIRYSDNFHSVAFTGRWSVKDYLALQAEIPFAFNKRKGTENAFYTGLSDVSFGVTGKLPTFVRHNTKHKVYLGFTVYAPTGEFRRSIDTTGFAPLIQQGVGAWAFIPNIEYNLFVKNFGYSVGASYRYALHNPDYLQIGGKAQLWMKGIFDKKVFETHIIPSLAFIGEYYQQNKFHTTAVDLSGGYVVSTEAGLDFKFIDKYAIGLKYRQPLASKLAKGKLQPYGTFAIQFNYFL